MGNVSPRSSGAGHAPMFTATIERLQITYGHERHHLHNSIATYWIVRAGVSDGVSVRSVVDGCRDFQTEVPLAK
eukprot:11156535-Lingulodinium_polyedra.AAC.1